MRSGDYRIIFRRLTEGEQQRLVLRLGCLSGKNAYVVARIIDRAEQERAIATLNLGELEER